MVRTQVQLTDDQARRLKRLAAAEGVSVAELVRRGLDWVLGEQKPVTRGERKRRAIRASGRFRSKAGNLAREHDRHLAEVLGR